MSENLQNNPNQTKRDSYEEVDSVVLFSLLGKFFSKIFNFIGSIFKALLSVLVFIIKAILDNIKLISVVIVASIIIGYVLEQYKEIKYESQMYVKPYFDSKYQLVNNIDYFNALISNKEWETLSRIFDISEEEAQQIIEFKINIGPESENERIMQYDTYLKSLDSVRAQDISFEDFIENRNIYSSDFFEITVESTKKDIFKSLEVGLNSSFENTYSEKKMKKRDSLITIQKLSIKQSIKSVDSLQKVYIRVLEEESKANSNTISISEGFSLEPENSKTKEFELLNKELELREELRKLEEKKIEEDVFFDTVSGFTEVGGISNSLMERYTILLPFFSFIVMCLVFATRRTINFVRSYGQ